MGNCLHPVAPSTSINDISSKLTLEEFWNESEWSYPYESLDYNDSSLEAAAPCHSCNLLDNSSLPFFILASVLGILASGAVLFALFRPLFHWNLCPGRLVLAQLAVGCVLFSIVVPLLAPGISITHSTVLCRLAHCVWYSSAFAQALLLGCRACLGPKLAEDQVPGLILGLTVGLWGAAILLGLPITLASDTNNGFCTLMSSRSLGALQSVHAAVCFAIFFLMPLGLVGAKGLRKVLGKGPAPWIDILCLWFIFWWLHGVVLGLDSLVRSRIILLPSCLAQKAFDFVLQLAEALAVSHCVATPLFLALFCHQATRASLPSQPFPARWSSHQESLGGKS
ncbi:atypical chemokine receptor 1 isoform X2 [Dasypus novemcinctus]|uniref:atypical chemokine receptor 1 isoform X2 n=1 Tax=Dasypus novemcinctus TaxID=9361 RepID=UPI0003CC14EC|nr:atypical chemokine receptor 1 isoform X2 [Dasypus novemcinctus]